MLTPPLSDLPDIPYPELVERAGAALPELPSDPRQILLALDIDGTILHPAGATERMIAAIQGARQLGINVSIATGRGMASTVPVVTQFGLDNEWTICSNGALTVRWHDEPQVAAMHTLDPVRPIEAVRGVIPEALFAVDRGMEGLLTSAPFPRGELMLEVVADNLADLTANPTTKLVVRTPHMDREDFAEAMASAPLDDIELAIGWTSWADMSPGGVTKASALQELSDRLGVPSRGTIAIGDGMNDIGMLRWAGHGVAMGGAEGAVVAAANAETGPVEQDGAAAVIQAVMDRFDA